jgi:hypothetical protein
VTRNGIRLRGAMKTRADGPCRCARCRGALSAPALVVNSLPVLNFCTHVLLGSDDNEIPNEGAAKVVILSRRAPPAVIQAACILSRSARTIIVRASCPLFPHTAMFISF